MYRNRLLKDIHKDFSDEEYEYESDTEEDFKYGNTLCHHVNERVRNHNKELHEKRFNKRLEFLKNASYEEIIKNCFTFEHYKINKNENKYYITVNDNQISISDKYEINDNSIIYYDDEYYNILTTINDKDSFYIHHYTVYDLDDSSGFFNGIT